MMRFNIATFRVVSEQVRPDRCEWDALEAMLTDPSRVLPGGVTVGALAGSELSVWSLMCATLCRSAV